MGKIRCFICKKDITNTEKVASYHNYPYQFWSEKTKNWVNKLRLAINGLMCSECAEMDLNVAHFMTKEKAIREQIKQELINEFNQKPLFERLRWIFGRK